MTAVKKIFDTQRKVIANMTSRGWKEIPHVSFIYEANLTKLLKFIQEEKDKHTPGFCSGINIILMRIMAEGLKAAPELNSTLKFNPWTVNGTLSEKDKIDANIAWKVSDERMMTINFHDIGGKSLKETEEYLSALKTKISSGNLKQPLFDLIVKNTLEETIHGHPLRSIGRIIGGIRGGGKIEPLKGTSKISYDSLPENRKLKRADLDIGSVTFSNIGAISKGINGSVALLEIIPPQIFAAAFGAIQKKPVVISDKDGSDIISIESIMPVTMAFDHRAVDFEALVPLLKRLEEILNNPKQMLNWQ